MRTKKVVLAVAVVILAKSLESGTSDELIDLMSPPEIRLANIVSKIAKFESNICKESGMPDQELVSIIVCHSRADHDYKTLVRERINRQNLFFLQQQEHPVFDSQGAALLSSPTDVLLDNDGFGGALKSLVASDMLRIMFTKKSDEKLQIALLFTADIRTI